MSDESLHEVNLNPPSGSITFHDEAQSRVLIGKPKGELGFVARTKWATAIAFKYSHIRTGLGRLAIVQKLLDRASVRAVSI